MHTEGQLFPNAIVTQAVHEYSAQKSTPVPDSLVTHRDDTIKWAEENSAEAEMMISPLQAQFTIFITKALGVKKVLEIGCFTGYSALAFAEALRNVPDAEITTLDLAGPHTDFALSAFAKNGPHPPITHISGPASTTLPTLQGKQYDLIFIDADKPGYVSYFKAVLSLGLLSPKGVIIADNTLRHGLVAISTSENPAAVRAEEVDLQRAKALDEFNEVVRLDPRVESVLVPLFDGLHFIRLRD